MSLVDDIFGSVADPLIDQWGISAFFLRRNDAYTYNPAIGTYMLNNFYIAGTPPNPAINTFIPGAIQNPATDFIVGSFYTTGSTRSMDMIRIPAKLIPLQISAEEVNGDVQSTDIKFLISGVGLNSYYPRITDMIEYQEGAVTRTAKIIAPVAYRGDSPVLRAVIARLT